MKTQQQNHENIQKHIELLSISVTLPRSLSVFSYTISCGIKLCICGGYTTTVDETADPEIRLSLELHNQLLFMFIWVVSSEGGGTVFIGEEKTGDVYLSLLYAFPV
jgi:hypothetical protein